MHISKLLDRTHISLIIISVILILTPLSAIQAFSQQSAIDYNQYYRYPFSIGIEYQSLNSFKEYGNDFNIYEIAAHFRWPFLKTPLFIPTMRLGIMNFDSQDADEPEKWDHKHYFFTLGILYSNRFTKNFEIGAEAAAGYSQAVFPNVVEDVDALGSGNLVLELGGRIGLNPSYNFNIDINPNLKYLHSLSALKEFNGLIFGIGFSAHFRFGRDPDSPAATIRSIRFDEVSIPSLFAAMQSYYVSNPIGTITISNTEKHTISDIDVSFYQAAYMDSPTPSATLAELGSGDSMEVDLYASFNEEVFRIEGITPLTGEIIVTYSSKGKPAEQRQPVSYDLHDKTAITWNDDRKVAAFITPADSALRNYSSYIRKSCKNDVILNYSEELQFAMQVFHALHEIGVIYQVDPLSPFTTVQENPMVVDSISLPRDTLKRSTGDCDDLTVLFNSLLETVGIETGFITVPGHIYPCFNTKVPSRSYRDLHPDREMMIDVDGSLWVPVEITMIGRSDFLSAWRKGSEEWHAFEKNPERRGFHLTRSSQELYRPVGLKETDLGLQYGDKKNIITAYKQDMGELVDLILYEYTEIAKMRGNKEDYNVLGTRCAKFNQFLKAEQAFMKALEIDPYYLQARVNLGSLMYLNNEYERALSQFMDVLDTLKGRNQVATLVRLQLLINISKTYYKMKEYELSKSYYEQAYEIDPEETERYSYLAKVSSDTSRAAEVFDTKLDILFLGEVY